MTNIAVPVPPILSEYKDFIREFVSGMIRKLDMNSHKNTPSIGDIPTMVGMMLGETGEFLKQYGEDQHDTNTLVELMDAANMAFLTYVALRRKGVKTTRDKTVDFLFTADFENGKVYYKASRAGSLYKKGDEATGYKNSNGYIYITINSYRSEFSSMRMPRSHLVWYLKNGKWPTGIIDHINGVKNDDRISNLRDISFSDNVYSKNKGKYGEYVTVYAPKGKENRVNYGKFCYQRRWLGKAIRVGYYDSPDEARTIGAEDWLKRVKGLEQESQRGINING